MSQLQKTMLSELQAQNKQYTDAYWDIFNNKEAVPADQQERMRTELLKYYARAVALLDGQTGLDKEREIAELEIKRLQIKEEARLREAEIKEEYRLKHVKLKEEADTKAERLTQEFAILREAEQETLNIKKSEIVPINKELPKRWWQRRVRYETNYAYELASQKAKLEAQKYLAAREDEVLKLGAEQSEIDELQFAVMHVISNYMGNKKYGRKTKAINEALSELIEPLCEMFARRERAINELNRRLSESDDKAFDEPSEPEQENTDILNDEEERNELQTRAATLLAAFCQKRIDELQLEQIGKPKRQRKRKVRHEENTEDNSHDR